MTRNLTALAQLIDMLAKHEGITSTGQIVARTGYSERRVWRARAELRATQTDTGDTDADATPLAQETADTLAPSAVQGVPEVRVSNPSLACAHIESPSEIDSTEEEVKICLSSKPKRKPKADDAPANGRRLDREWTLPDEWRQWAATNHPGVKPEQIDFQADKFRDYWIAQPGARGRKLDWKATWRNWCRNGLVTGHVQKPQYTAAYQTQGPAAFADCYRQ